MLKNSKLKNSVRAGALAVATAMTAMGGAGLSMQAGAVNIAPDGLGEVMIFPYYTTRNNWKGYIHLINTSDDTVFLKIRFNEGENSRDALDFNIALSPYDAWTGAIVPNRNGSAPYAITAGSRILVSDNSCTVPLAKPLDASGTPNLAIPQFHFNANGYSGKSNDTGSAGLDRTSEGYITMFSMGVIKQDSDGKVEGIVDDAATAINEVVYAQKIVDAIDHQKVLDDNDTAFNINDDKYISSDNRNDNTAVPPGCNWLDSQIGVTIPTEFENILSEPTNVLKSSFVLINTVEGVAQGYDPVVLANFYNPHLTAVDGAGATGQNLITVPSSTEPSLDSANPARAYFISSTSGQSVTPVPALGTFTRGVDAVSALLSRHTIINDYNVRNSASSDWVVTFPTKAFYVDADINGKGGTFFKIKGAAVTNAPYPPFSNALVGGHVFAQAKKKNQAGDFIETDADVQGKGKSCVNITANMWDREEFNKPSSEITEESLVSPLPDLEDGDNQAALCYEANILSFGGDSRFYPENKTTADFKLYHALFEGKRDDMPGYGGWAKLSFNKPKLSAATSTFNALPVVGMKLETRPHPNGAAKQYGFSTSHAYERGTINEANYTAP